MKKSIYIILGTLLSLIVLSQELCAQDKIQLTKADYHLWGSLRTISISEKGNWVSYKILYNSNPDSLFVINTASKKKYGFPEGTLSKFMAENKFVFLQNDSLVIFGLDDKKYNIVRNVLRFNISANEKFIVSEEKTASSSNNLCIRNQQGELLYSIKNIGSYTWNPTRDRIAWGTKGGAAAVGILSLKNKIEQTTIVKSPDAEYSVPKWQGNSEGIIFLKVSEELDKENTLQYYNLSEQRLYVLTAEASNFPINMSIDANPVIPLHFSKDGSKVVFGLKNRDNVEKFPEIGVEIWYASDKLLYPDRKLVASIGGQQFTAVWNPCTGAVQQLTTLNEPSIMFTGDMEYALTSNPLQYHPQYKLFADRDYYLTEISTGRKKLFLEKQSSQPDMIRLSPDGNYISYYRKSDWWIYNINKKSHTNLTKALPVEWDNRKLDPGNQQNVWGLAGWTYDGKSVLYYDYYDIWLISIDGKKRKRLTKGRETKTRFRFDKRDLDLRKNSSGLDFFMIDLKEERRLTAFNTYDASSGYYILKPNKKVIPLVFGNKAISRFLKAEKKGAMVYEVQSFDNPPAIMFKKNIKAQSELLFQSNPHHDHYQWGFSKMIHYNSPMDKELNGALFYPAGYKPGQKYPMIVWIYETVSGSLNKYVNPTMKNPLGFNIANLTSKGYFVLLADIAYEKGEPGKSATKCVISAVNKVMEMNLLNGKIGLIGQSFGGYETNFIITQTDIFSAAVSGVGISNIIQHYFSLHSENNKVDAWRYENQQFRVGAPFYEDPEAYFRNSPILHAKNINTPLLTWVGLLDRNVPPVQTLTFYTALRRLKKEHIMLRYPGDGHIFFNPKNQIDLTMRIQQWFGHYLKNEPAREWMERAIMNSSAVRGKISEMESGWSQKPD